MWWRMSLILALKRQGQVEVSEFYARLGYKVRCCLSKIKNQRGQGVSAKSSKQSGREVLETLRTVTLYLVLLHGEVLWDMVPDTR